MTFKTPYFELRRVNDDGGIESSTPELYSVLGLPGDTRMDRRGFLGTGLAMGGVLTAAGMSTSCSRDAAEQDQGDTALPKQTCGDFVWAHRQPVSSVAISPDGKWLASGSGDETVKLWTFPEGKLHTTLKGLAAYVNSVAFSPDGKWLATGTGTETIKLWTLPEGELHATLEGHEKRVWSLAFSPDGKWLASGSADGTIKLWSQPDGKLHNTLKGPWHEFFSSDGFSSVAFSPDGKWLASGSVDGIVKLWTLPDGKLHDTLKRHWREFLSLDGFSSVAFSPDGKWLASGSVDETIKLWTLPEGKLQVTLAGHQDEVTSVAFSPDGKWLASGSYDTTVKLWTLPEGKLHATLDGHEDHVNGVAFGPDGKWLASGSNDKTIRFWTLPTGELETCLFDSVTLGSSTEVLQYTAANTSAQTITYTVPCGSPIPAGAVCTCNCVSGTYRTPSSSGGGGSYSICTCVPVYVCQAHRLLAGDAVVRTMAEELLLLMGLGELAYMRWAASEVGGRLRTRIEALIGALRHGAAPNLARWPSPRVLASYLGHEDQVTAFMAAQLLLWRADRPRYRLTEPLERRARAILRDGEARHQAVRAQVAAFVSDSRLC